jgi:AsmA protein
MARYARIIWLVGLSAVLGTAAWLALGGPIDASRLRADIERGVSRATGRQLTISGPLRVTMGWSPVISADRVALANLPGGTAPWMIAAKSLRAQVALLPLLNGAVELQNVTLDGAEILLETTPDGHPNWQFQPAHRDFSAASGEPASAGGGHTFALQRLLLTHGQLTWRQPGGTSLVAAVDRAEITADSATSPLSASAQGTSYGVPFALTAAAGSYSRLQGGPVTALAGAWPLGATLTAAGATLKLDGGITHPDERRGYSFVLTGNAPDMTALRPWLPARLAMPWKDVNFTTRITDGNNAVFRTNALSLRTGAADLGAAVPGLVVKEALLSAPGPGQQATLSVDGTYQGAPLRIAANATQPDVLAANLPVPVSFSFQAGAATAGAHGTVPMSLAGNGIDLAVDVHAPSLADLSALAGRPLPDIRDVQASGHLADAGFRLRGLNFRDLSVTSSAGDMAGSVTAAWAPVLALNGTLTSHHLDLDAILAAWRMLHQTAPASAAGAPPPPDAAPADPGDAAFLSDTPLPFAALRGADADLTLNLDGVTFGGEQYHDLAGHLLATAGKVVLNPLRVVTPHGTIIAGATVDASATPAPVALNLRSPGLSAAGITALFGYPGGATGNLQVDAQLSGIGDTSRALAASLQGHLGMTLVGGTVSDALLQPLLGAALDAASVPPLEGTTPVRCFASRTEFVHGRGHLRGFALDTPKLALSGSGDIDFVDETVSLHLRPAVRLGGTGVSAPVSLSGPFGHLHAALDPVLDGRVGISIGGAGPGDAGCGAMLGQARGGMPGPIPAAAPTQSEPRKKPIDLLKGLFH